MLSVGIAIGSSMHDGWVLDPVPFELGSDTGPAHRIKVASDPLRGVGGAATTNIVQQAPKSVLVSLKDLVRIFTNGNRVLFVLMNSLFKALLHPVATSNPVHGVQLTAIFRAVCMCLVPAHYAPLPTI